MEKTEFEDYAAVIGEKLSQLVLKKRPPLVSDEVVPITELSVTTLITPNRYFESNVIETCIRHRLKRRGIYTSNFYMIAGQEIHELLRVAVESYMLDKLNSGKMPEIYPERNVSSEFPFELKNEKTLNVKLKGKLDYLVIYNGPKGPQAEIVEIKTVQTTKASSHDARENQAKKQACVYSILVEKALGIPAPFATIFFAELPLRKLRIPTDFNPTPLDVYYKKYLGALGALTEYSFLETWQKMISSLHFQSLADNISCPLEFNDLCPLHVATGKNEFYTIKEYLKGILE